MADSNNSEWLSRQHLSRRAALRAAILGATIPGALYLAKAANSADAADDNIYIPGAPNFLELGHGWPGKEANAGKITYRQWSDALDIVGAGTEPGYRKVKIWDDLYVQGLLNLRAYIVDPEVPRAWTAFLYAKDVNGQSKPFWKDATGTAQPLVARSATLIVAASDASPQSKLGADYVCDGIADEEEIQAALGALPAGGGVVQLSEGEFTPAATITVGVKQHLRGVGLATKITPSVVLAPCIDVTGTMALVSDLLLGGSCTIGIRISGYAAVLRDLLIGDIDGSGVKVTGAEQFLENVQIGNCNVGLEIASGSWDTSLTTVWIGGDGTHAGSADGILCAGNAGAIAATNVHVWGYDDLLDLSGSAWNFYFSNCSFYDRCKRVIHMHANAGGGAGEIFFDFCSFGRGDHGTVGTTPDVDIYEANPFAGAFVNIRFSNCRFLYHAASQSIAAIRLNTPYATTHGPIHINDCIFDTGYTSGVIVTTAGTNWNLKVHDNDGYVTENSGTSTLVNGQTSIAVTHGLAVTPAIGDVIVTPIEAWGAATQYWISAYSSTTFTITVDQDPGQDVDFAWKAVVL